MVQTQDFTNNYPPQDPTTTFSHHHHHPQHHHHHQHPHHYHLHQRAYPNGGSPTFYAYPDGYAYTQGYPHTHPPHSPTKGQPKPLPIIDPSTRSSVEIVAPVPRERKILDIKDPKTKEVVPIGKKSQRVPLPIVDPTTKEVVIPSSPTSSTATSSTSDAFSSPTPAASSTPPSVSGSPGSPSASQTHTEPEEKATHTEAESPAKEKSTAESSDEEEEERSCPSSPAQDADSSPPASPATSDISRSPPSTSPATSSSPVVQTSVTPATTKESVMQGASRAPQIVSMQSSVDDLVFRPGSKFGVCIPITPKPSADSAFTMEPVCKKDHTANRAQGAEKGDSETGTCRRYTREQLLRLKASASPPPESMQRLGCYVDYARALQHPKDSAFGHQVSNSFDALQNRANGPAFCSSNAKKGCTEDIVLKKVRGILNRITPETYTSLFDRLWAEMNNDKVDVMGLLERVVSTIFEVSLDQPNYSAMYADICKELCMRIAKNYPKGETGNQGAWSEFRRILLNKCQRRFEEGLSHKPVVPPPTVTEEEKEKITKQEDLFRKASLGNISFMSELFKRSLLGEKIMHEVIKTLLADNEHSDLLEALCRMLTSAGERLDRLEAKQHMDDYFVKLEVIARSQHVSRIRFLIQNVVELRKNGWVERFQKKQGGGEWKETDFGAPPPKPAKSESTAKAEKPQKPTTEKTHKPAPKAASSNKASQPKPTATSSSGTAVVDVPGKARSLLQDWAAEPREDEWVLKALEEIPKASHTQFFLSMIRTAVEGSRFEEERKQFPHLCSLYVKAKLVQQKTVEDAFVQFMDVARASSMWMDVPKIWNHLSLLVTGALHVNVIKFDTLSPMTAALVGQGDKNADAEEEDARIRKELFKFIRSITLCLKENVDLFNCEKASSLFAAVQKAATGKKKQGKKPKFANIEEFGAAIDNLEQGQQQPQNE